MFETRLTQFAWKIKAKPRGFLPTGLGNTITKPNSHSLLAFSKGLAWPGVSLSYIASFEAGRVHSPREKGKGGCKGDGMTCMCE